MDLPLVNSHMCHQLTGLITAMVNDHLSFNTLCKHMHTHMVYQLCYVLNLKDQKLWIFTLFSKAGGPPWTSIALSILRVSPKNIMNWSLLMTFSCRPEYIDTFDHMVWQGKEHASVSLTNFNMTFFTEHISPSIINRIVAYLMLLKKAR